MTTQWSPFSSLAMTLGLSLLVLLGCGWRLAARTPIGPAAGDDDQPRELGDVRWRRSYEGTLEEAKHTGRPVALLFQEIPGCATCQQFGDAPLSNPLLVSAFEHLFVPLAISNNAPGEDARILEKYGEPSWNNPVLRFVDASGKDLIPRKDGLYESHLVAGRMIQALKIARRPVPAWLTLAEQEARPRTLERTTFAMHCYWEGETRLGAIDGVVRTRAGWLDGREVVEAWWDPIVTDAETLVNAAHQLECTHHVHTTTEATLQIARRIVGDAASLDERESKPVRASEQKYRLRHSYLRAVPMSPAQATKINAAVVGQGDPLQWLSPDQLKLARELLRLDRVRPEHDAWPGAVITLDPDAHRDATEKLKSWISEQSAATK